jgi:hypothetical protein
MATDGPAKRASILTDGAIEAFVDLVLDFLERKEREQSALKPRQQTKQRAARQRGKR